jgi:hypothetical protein
MRLLSLLLCASVSAETLVWDPSPGADAYLVSRITRRDVTTSTNLDLGTLPAGEHWFAVQAIAGTNQSVLSEMIHYVKVDAATNPLPSSITWGRMVSSNQLGNVRLWGMVSNEVVIVPASRWRWETNGALVFPALYTGSYKLSVGAGQMRLMVETNGVEVGGE